MIILGRRGISVPTYTYISCLSLPSSSTLFCMYFWFDAVVSILVLLCKYFSKSQVMSQVSLKGTISFIWPETGSAFQLLKELSIDFSPPSSGIGLLFFYCFQFKSMFHCLISWMPSSFTDLYFISILAPVLFFLSFQSPIHFSEFK